MTLFFITSATDFLPFPAGASWHSIKIAALGHGGAKGGGWSFLPVLPQPAHARSLQASKETVAEEGRTPPPLTNNYFKLFLLLFGKWPGSVRCAAGYPPFLLPPGANTDAHGALQCHDASRQFSL